MSTSRRIKRNRKKKRGGGGSGGGGADQAKVDELLTAMTRLTRINQVGGEALSSVSQLIGELQEPYNALGEAVTRGDVEAARSIMPKVTEKLTELAGAIAEAGRKAGEIADEMDVDAG